MSDMLRLTPRFRKRVIELSFEEKAQLNTMIDLLIPSDKDFPAPSSLHLTDELLRHLQPNAEHKTTLLLNEKRLRTVLHELNLHAGGSFCLAGSEKQQVLMRNLEKREPAFFQALWSLVSHSYYALLATSWHSRVS
ncbi:hypothetical protein [Tengunoibacter tsumagoiensis]|uniref:Uncharacterized protein n=1 Tax=Tengunoibacter tsumagoiensis TaxID=2014871 RepID=A0A401ZZG8_9CHLR|nr:hypothetical protein [Tengunoibacter tsumagoiensis]GCE12255.1 hypothetical protein KTT_21140 [Tengunoibacter tsumagoiensis]